MPTLRISEVSNKVLLQLVLYLLIGFNHSLLQPCYVIVSLISVMTTKNTGVFRFIVIMYKEDECVTQNLI